MSKNNNNKLWIIMFIFFIISILISLSGVYITTEMKTVNKFVNIDFTGWGWVTCPDEHCVKISHGFDKEGIYCNVPITECPSNEYNVDNYSICYDIWRDYRYNTPYITFNVNHHYGFVSSCVVPVYKKHLIFKKAKG